MTELKVGYARGVDRRPGRHRATRRLTALGVDPDRIYVDHGLTGTNRARPGLREAMAACRSGDTFVVTKLDRLARSVPDARDSSLGRLSGSARGGTLASMSATASDLFDGPVPLMSSKAQESIPRSATGTLDWAYEMKWDGFRASMQVRPDGHVTYWSRRGTDLSSAFPDLVEAARSQVPTGVVCDGEAVAWVDGRLSFDHLQQRMVSSPAATARLARQHPASYVAFDILAVDGTDVRGLPWRDRRLLLEELGAGFAPPLQVSPYTIDHATAVEWFTELTEATGVEGIVAKRLSSRYLAGDRAAWVKVKRRSLVDGIVGAVVGPVSWPEAVVVGRYTAEGVLRIVGRSTALASRQAQELAGLLTEVPAADHPWPVEISGGHFGGGPVAITHVNPVLVVEVAADTALQAGRHRHALRVVRLRIDLAVQDVEPA